MLRCSRIDDLISFCYSRQMAICKSNCSRKGYANKINFFCILYSEWWVGLRHIIFKLRIKYNQSFNSSWLWWHRKVAQRSKMNAIMNANCKVNAWHFYDFVISLFMPHPVSERCVHFTYYTTAYATGVPRSRWHFQCECTSSKLNLQNRLGFKSRSFTHFPSLAICAK